MKRIVLFSVITLLIIGQILNTKTQKMLISGNEDLIEIHSDVKEDRG